MEGFYPFDEKINPKYLRKKSGKNQIFECLKML
jgi:hypothetical protein